MHISIENYLAQQQRLPASGKHIVACYDAQHIIVYQAYKPSIADFAVQHQKLGGEGYKDTRMTWIKPGFMWMMYRSGWATKPDQERILAISLKQTDFEELLKQAVPTSFKPTLYASEEEWKNALQASQVQVQWDPDHDPSGKKLSRRAIQIGLKGTVAQLYAREWIISIEDITDFVHAQSQQLHTQGIQVLEVPAEEAYMPHRTDLYGLYP